MTIPGQFFFSFSSFQTHALQFLQQINVKKCQSTMWHWGLNPQTSEHESPSITTRPWAVFAVQLHLKGTVQKTLFLQQCNCHAQVMRMCLKLGSKKIALFQFSFISSTKCSQLHAMENAFSAFLYATTSLMHDTSNKRKYTIMHIDILPLHNTTYATWYLK